MDLVRAVALPAAAVGMVVSIVAGLMGGVGFATLLLRGVLSALLAGGGAYGLIMAAGQLLPGLLDRGETAGGGQGNDEESDGPGEGAMTADGSRSSVAGSRLNIVVEDDTSGAASSDDYADDESVGELVEEVEEQFADDEEGVMRAAIAEERGIDDGPVADGEVDDMPDIGSFAGSFATAVPSDDEESGSSVFEEQAYSPTPSTSGGSGGGRQRKGGAAGNDPETIARALQTMMKRDGG